MTSTQNPRKPQSAARGVIGDKKRTHTTMEARSRRPRRRTRNNRGSGGRSSGGRNDSRSDGASDNTRAGTPQQTAAPSQQQSRVLELPPQITVHDLAEQMRVSPIELIKQLMNAGVMANINQVIDYDTASIVCEDMGYTVQEPKAPEPEPVAEEKAAEAPVTKREYTEEEKKNLRSRPPVVTILGHVDHGKTSLLDVIRKTNVQAGEAGGITQAIGAYQVSANDKRITFLDTPGHAAFTAMRARGAQSTDIAVLVVAADDGVQPQTLEAISHARAAKVPIIVAINKMDLASANPDHVKQQLSDVGLVPEDWGGDTICVPVSARAKMGIDTLLEMILLVAELAEFVANPRSVAEGTVIEGKLERSRGATATLLVQDGVLKTGDALVIGNSYGKVRAMFDFQGKTLKRATPSTPAVVIGLRDVPEAGDRFVVVGSEKEAREAAEELQRSAAEAPARRLEALSLEDLYAQAQAGSVQALNLILKADVQGSLEPIRNSLEQLDIGDLKVKFVLQGVGNIAESDVTLAAASQAIIIGFGVSADPSALRLAETEGIEIRTYNIIYRVIEDVQLALQGMLEPEYEDVLQGQGVVRQVFRSSRLGVIAGIRVTEGRALRNAKAKVKRNDEEIHAGDVASLKRFTEDAREVRSGMECGVAVNGCKDFEEGDVIEFYTREVKQR